MAGKAKKPAILKRLKKIYAEIPEEKKPVAEELMRELDFMAESLAKLKEQVKEKGPVELFVQGKQRFYRENPAMKVYNATTKQYAAIYKQICDLVPRQMTPKEEPDGFEDFQQGREDI